MAPLVAREKTAEPNPAKVTASDTYDFVLDLNTNPQGYDISQIDSFSGWNDSRAGQAYTISFSTVGDPSFTQIFSVSVAASGESLVTNVFDDTGALLGTGVDVIRFDVGVNGNGNVWREVDVIGEPTGNSITSFTAAPETIPSDAPVTLSWEFDPAATAATIDQSVGNILPMTNASGIGSVLLDPGPAVTTTYQLSVTAGGNVSNRAVTVTIDNDPIINSFTSSQSSIAPGTDVTLDWDVVNSDTLTLNGITIDPGVTSTTVTPLATTTYTLVATNAEATRSATLTIDVANTPNTLPANGRFVEVVKNSTSQTQLHISEIEAFAYGTAPDSADADGTSSNDLVQNGSPSTEFPPTTTSILHGDPDSVFDGNIESSSAVWTTADGLGVEPRYMLDLGASSGIDIVRIFSRGDGAAALRLENFTVNIYADNGSGLPGNLVSSATFPDRAPSGNEGNVELSLGIPDPGISSFTVDKQLIPSAAPITLSWQVSTNTSSVSIDNGVGDVTAMTDASGSGSVVIDPGPSAPTTYSLLAINPNGSSAAQVAVEVTDLPIIFDLATSTGIVAPGSPVTLSWDVANATSLDLNGTDVTGQTGTTITPSSSTTYTLTATNANGTSNSELRIRVALPNEPTISEFLASNDAGIEDEDGDNSDWIEIENPTNSAVNLDGYYLTDDADDLTKWRIPAETIAAGDQLLVFASSKDRATAGSELHTNFSLSASGEYLALVKPDGTTIVNEFSPTYPEQFADISFGFDSTALLEGYFVNATPGESNSAAFTNIVADTAFSVDRGFYNAPIAVAITSETSGAEIRYTLDGTKPTESVGLVYSTPINLSQTTVLRAAAFKDGFVPTNVDTHTYIFPTDVIAQSNMRTSITQDSVYGPQMADSLQAVPTISLVFQGDIERTEKEASVELINFESGQTQLDAGMERIGNFNTDFSKRSMRLSFRRIYGPGKLRFPVYEGHDYPIPPADEIDSIDLRSGNHDMSRRGAYMSNRFTDDTMLDMGNIAPHGRFVHVYINGLYWGQYHLRERWNGAMLSEYFGGNKDEYEAINANDRFEQDLRAFDGTGEQWAEADALSQGPQPFANTASHIDMANYIDFMLLYVSGNCESEFRSAASVPRGVPFKFFLKDADGYLRPVRHSADDPGPLDLMEILLEEDDPDFKTLLADRIHTHYFNDGAFTPAANIARLQERVDEIQFSFLSESARWGERTPDSWQAYQDNLISNHFPGLTNTMINRFEAAGMYPSLAAPSFNQHGGSVSAGFALTMTAPTGTIYYTLDGTDPRLGIADGGTGNGSVASSAMQYSAAIPINATTTVRSRVFDGSDWSAINEASFTRDLGSLVISEIMYNPSPPTPAEIAAGFDDGDDFEFIEILNTGAAPVDLDSTQMTGGITFNLTGTLAAGGRLLLVEDQDAFEFRYGSGLTIAGEYSGKLSDGGELLELVDPLGQPIRTFTYDDQSPWPTTPDGDGFSLVLTDPQSLPDHNIPASWTASNNPGGTPGKTETTSQSYATWATGNGAGANDEDQDEDGLVNLLEFALGGDPFSSSTAALPTAQVSELEIGATPSRYLTITFDHILGSDLTISAQTSFDLENWDDAVLDRITYHGDGSATSIYRSANPVDSETRHTSAPTSN